MSAVYSGRQRPSYEEEELSAMYLQAMNALHDEDADPGGARTPIAIHSAPIIPRDSTQYDAAGIGTPVHRLCLSNWISNSCSKLFSCIQQTEPRRCPISERSNCCAKI
jgi:hypothetical protein